MSESVVSTGDAGDGSLAQPEKHWAYALVPGWAIRRVLIPRGVLGRISSMMMRRINGEMNQSMVELLELEGHEQVLEIGFGPGNAIGLLLARLPRGRVVGIDPSPLMLREATGRNRAAIDAGRVQLDPGYANQLPYGDCLFDRVCSANSVQLWGDLQAVFAEIQRVLRPGGQLVLVVHEWASEGDLRAEIGKGLAGDRFVGIEVSSTVDRSGSTLQVRARRDGR